MLPNREYLRTPIDAASTARRFGHDFKLAARLHGQGLNPYKGQMPVFLVDLATEGSLTEPRGVPLRHSKLFNTQAAVSAFELQHEIEAFDKAYQPDNVVHIVLRPPLALGEVKMNGEKRLLDENGRCPIVNLRLAQKAFNNCVQRAVAELDRRQVIVPLLVARHLVPFEGGATFDLHAHWVGQLKQEDSLVAQEYLSSIFGADRLWISSVMEPAGRRSFSATSGYPVWRLANQDWNAVDDDHLKDFFHQASGLRSVDALGPFRDFRAQGRASSSEGTGDDGDDQDAQISDEGECQAEPDEPFVMPDEAFEAPADDTAASPRDYRADGGADVSHFLASEPARQPILFSCHFAWLGLTRRYVAQVGNYTSFAELRQYYDLDDAIAFAKRHVEETHSYLFKPAIHENSFGVTEGTAGTAVGVGESRPTAEPQHADAKKAAAGAGTAGTAVGVGESRPAAKPQQADAKKAAAGAGTAGTAVGAGESRPAAEPQQADAPKAAAYDGTVGAQASVNGRAKDLPLTLEREAGINSDTGDRTLAGLTLELTVQAQSGPATATLRLRMPGVHSEQH